MKRRVARLSMVFALAARLGSGPAQAQEPGTKAARTSVESVAFAHRQPELRGEFGHSGHAVSKRHHAGEMAVRRADRTCAVGSVEVAYVEERNVHHDASRRAGWRVRGLPIQCEFRSEGGGRRNRDGDS